MRRSLLVALLVGGVLVSSCGGEGGDDPFASGADEAATTRWASPDEFAWLSRLGDWNDELDEALDAALGADEDEENVDRILSEPGPERRSYLERLRPYERCSHTLRSRVGQPPPGRLEFTMRRLLLACRFYEQHGAIPCSQGQPLPRIRGGEPAQPDRAGAEPRRVAARREGGRRAVLVARRLAPAAPGAAHARAGRR